MILQFAKIFSERLRWSLKFAGCLLICCCCWSPNKMLGQSFLQPAVHESTLPTRWDSSSPSWTATLPGYGQSSPIVLGDRVYLTSVDGPNKETGWLTCLDLTTGEPIWQRSEPLSFTNASGPMVSRAAPSPAADADGVYVLFESGDFFAWNHAGQLQWKRSLQADYGPFVNKFGLAASVAQCDSLCFVLLEHSGPSHLLGIDKRTGQETWKAERGARGHSWTSPAVMRTDGGDYVLVSSLGNVDAYRANDGRKMFTFDGLGGNSVATPIDRGNGRFLVSSLIRPADGPVENATRSNRLLRLVHEDGDCRIRNEWTATEARGGFGSPVLHDPYSYWISAQGVLYCVDSETGDAHYAERLPCGGCWATPLIADGRLYCFGKEGETVIVELGDRYRVVSEDNHLWPDETQTLYAAVAIPEGLLLRSGQRVYRVDTPRETAPGGVN